MRELCERKGVEIIEAECCLDHIHMLVAIPPHLSVAAFMGYLKSKSSLMIFDRHADLKYKYGNRHFWCRGYYVDTVGKYEGAIKEYIKNQLQDDRMNDQISMKELIDPFTGKQEKQGLGKPPVQRVVMIAPRCFSRFGSETLDGEYKLTEIIGLYII